MIFGDFDGFLDAMDIHESHLKALCHENTITQIEPINNPVVA